MAAADPSDFYAVHSALRGGAGAIAAAVEHLDRRDARHISAIDRYWRGFAGELQAHHTVEDATFYPALIERVPVAAEHLGRLADEHHRLDDLIAEADAQINRLVDGDDVIGPATGSLRRFDEVLQRHLDFEDADLIPLFARHFEQSEYAALSKQAIQSLGLGKQVFFTVPFIALSAEPEVRDALLQSAGIPFRVLYRLTRRSHRRLAKAAFGALPCELPPRGVMTP